MGWLHWPPDAVMKADVNAIRLALLAHTELLKSIFGSPKKKGDQQPVAANDEPTAPAKRGISHADWNAFKVRSNSRFVKPPRGKRGSKADG